MRCAQIDSFPQNPAEPIPAGRASPCWHIVARFGSTISRAPFHAGR